MMCFNDIHYAYRTGDVRTHALRAVTLTVCEAEHVAVLGANGSGKSTLARMANGLMVPDSGIVTVDDIDTRDESRSLEVRQRVGMVFQHPDDQIVATTVEDEAAFGPENLGLPREEVRERVDEAVSTVGLSGLERREPHRLSGGQKQRLAMAGALAMRPAYLVLDEPASMLDSAGRTEVLSTIGRLRSAGTGILHVTHDLADVLRADRAAVLRDGGLAFDGAVSRLLGDAALLEACGLELPPLSEMVSVLRSEGVVVEPGVADAEELVEALWH